MPSPSLASHKNKLSVISHTILYPGDALELSPEEARATITVLTPHKEK